MTAFCIPTSLSTSLMLLLCAVHPPSSLANPPAPPGQAETGPGGKDYPHASYRVTERGKGNGQYWIFEPAEPAPKGKVPVVLFLHGWGGMEPPPYGAWIRHLVRKGNIVLYPRYQETLLTPPNDFTAGMLGAVRAAIEILETEEGRARPDRDRWAVVGHSFGGALAFNYAALAAKEKLPVPKALMALEPGTGNERRTRFPFDQADPATVDPATLILMVVGDRDRLVKDITAKALWKGLSRVPADRKDFVTFRTDESGKPALVADHMFPVAPDSNVLDPKRGPAERIPAGQDRMTLAKESETRPILAVDALDWRGSWRLFDALLHAAFTGEGKDECLGGTDAQKDMGKWSDGTPVLTPVVTDDP